MISNLGACSQNWNIFKNTNKTNNTSNAKLSIWRSESRVAPPNHFAFCADTVLNGGWSSAMRIGGRYMNATANWSENSSENKPIMLMQGTDVDGTKFKVEVSIRDIDPRSASFIEMFALDAYSNLTGGPSLGRGIGLLTASETAFGGDAFSKFNFIEPVNDALDGIRRFGNNMESYMRLRSILDQMLKFVSQDRAILPTQVLIELFNNDR